LALPGSNLTLWRMALVSFTPVPRQGNSFGAQFEEVNVVTLGSQTLDDRLKILIAAGTKLRNRPKLASGRFVVVPGDARRVAERALESLVNTVAIAERCDRTIASAFPSVAFEPGDEEGRAWLETYDGIYELGRVTDVPNLTGDPILLGDNEVMAGLTDRWDGVALLAEAFAHEHPTGRLHELFRVFERAFALPARNLGAPLVRFLHRRYGYTDQEVDSWIELRDPATHADARATFVLEGEVRPILRRMEQAAVDVLINKSVWRAPQPDRRELWRPTAWTKNSGGEGVAHLRTRGQIEAQLLDPFGAYPTDLETTWSKLPDGWWAPRVETKTDERGFFVLPEGQLDE
jgi:hypothetical protein